MSRWRWLFCIVAVATLALVTALMNFRTYSTAKYRGDGQIRDTGLWTYPRYHITFPQISLAEPGEYVYRCSGLPPEPLTLRLEIDGSSDYDVASRLNTVLDVRLATDDTETVSHASGALREWEQSWIPADASGAFWHPQLRDMRVSREQEYLLSIIVKDVDLNSPPLVVEPTLTGGGNEFP